MLRKTVFGLSLVAVVATGAAAQVPYAEGFTFVTGGSSFNGYQGKFSTTAGGELAGVPFQVWCVDPLQYAYNNTTVTAEITPFASSNYANTLEYQRFSTTLATDKMRYEEAAYLALQMSVAGADINNLEYAIWTVMGYTQEITSTTPTFANITTLTGYNSTKVNNFLTAAASNYGSVVAADWGVITSPVSGTNGQEFIYYSPTGTTQAVVPEPATVSMLAMGMVGMAGATFRRRRQRKA